MSKEKENSIRQTFVSWSTNQAPPPALLLPEVSVSGKKIDLVCVEEPLDTTSLRGRGSDLVKRYRLDTWLKSYTSFKPEWVRRLGLNKRQMDAVADQLIGKSVWVVELKDSLTKVGLV